MNLLATTIPGLEEVAIAALKAEKLRGVRILHVEDGLVIFTAEALPPLPYFNNVFQVLAEYPARNMTDALTNLLADNHWPKVLKGAVSKTERNFRIFLSDSNRLVPAPGPLMGRFLTAIESLGLKHVKEKPQLEVWLLKRASGHAYLTKRLTRARLTEKDLAPGELRPEMAALITFLSEPKEDDIFLDPFCGTGAIPVARARFPFNMMFVSDVDAEKVKKLRSSNRLKDKKTQPVILRTADATKLDKIEDGFVDKVVTDPPWGKFDKENLLELPHMYEKALREQCRIVKKGGLIIWLSAQKDWLDRLTRGLKNELTLEYSADILVSGQKARIMKWRRR